MISDLPREVAVMITGRRLTDDQVMTIRVSLHCLRDELRINGLGKDDAGQRMAREYAAKIDKILGLME